jgi:hypothetical protein
VSTAIAKTGGAGFSLQPQNVTEAMQMAEMLSKSQMIPKNYQNKPQDTLVAMMMGSELGLHPIQALQNIAVINGKPSIYGDAMLALVQNHSAFGGIQESFDEAAQVATCIVWRKNGEKHTVTFSQADAKQAELWAKAGPWTQYPKRMMTFRARGFALRDQFADALAGLISREEAEDMPEQDMGSAQRHEKPKEVTAIEYYPADQFDANFPKWEAAIQAGKTTPQKMIDLVVTKGALTEAQENQLKSIERVAA